MAGKTKPKVTICEPGFAWGYSKIDQEATDGSIKACIALDDLERKREKRNKKFGRRKLNGRGLKILPTKP